MAVQYLSYTTATADYSGGNGTLSVGVPSGLTTDDLWVISSGCDTPSHPSNVVQLASGFTAVSDGVASASSDWPQLRSQWKKAGASESSAGVPFGVTGPFAVWESQAASMRFSGQDLTTPIGNTNTGANAAGGATPQTVTPGAITIGADGSMVLEHTGFDPSNNTGAAISPSSGYTEIHDFGSNINNDCATEVAYKAVNSGTETPGSVSCSVSSGSIDQLISQVIEIKASTLGGGWNLTGTGPRSVALMGAGPLGSGTVAAFTQSTADANNRTGSVSKSLGAVTAVATGKVAISGAVSKTLGALTAAATGKLNISGSTTRTLGALTLSSSGALRIVGTLDKTLGTLTLAATGTLASGITGSLAKTLGALTLASTGTVRIAGSVAKTLGTLTAASTGTLRIAGSTAVSLGSLTAVSTAQLAIAAQLNATLGALAPAATGDLALVGSAARTLGALTASATGALRIAGTLDKTLGDLTLVAAGNSGNNGRVEATLSALTAAASGAITLSGVVDEPLGPLTAAATGELSGAGIVQVQTGGKSRKRIQRPPFFELANRPPLREPIDGRVSALLGALTLQAQGRLAQRGRIEAMLGGLQMQASGAMSWSDEYLDAEDDLILQSAGQPVLAE